MFWVIDGEVKGSHDRGLKQLFFKWVAIGEVPTLHRLLLCVCTLSLLLEAVEVFVVEQVELVVIVQQYLAKIIKLKGAALRGQQILLKVGILKASLHNLELTGCDV